MEMLASKMPVTGMSRPGNASGILLTRVWTLKQATNMASTGCVSKNLVLDRSESTTAVEASISSELLMLAGAGEGAVYATISTF